MDTLEPRNGDERRPAFGTAPLPGTGAGTSTPGTTGPTPAGRAEFDLVGYHVEATDGRIGKIDEASHATDESYLVVDTGPWIFGKKVLIPAGTVTHIDHTDRKVYVDRTKDQVKASPEFDADLYTETGVPRQGRRLLRRHLPDPAHVTDGSTRTGGRCGVPRTGRHRLRPVQRARSVSRWARMAARWSAVTPIDSA